MDLASTGWSANLLAEVAVLPITEKSESSSLLFLLQGHTTEWLAQGEGAVHLAWVVGCFNLGWGYFMFWVLRM